jgi:ammonia channel protein AmtB
VISADNVDIGWILFCAVLVLFMQAGFTCETWEGRARGER